MPRNKSRLFIALFTAFILAMSIGGLLTSWHLVKMHYEDPGRTLKLFETYPILKPLKMRIPEKYIQPVKIVADTKQEELENMYNVFGPAGSGEGKPDNKENKKEKKKENKDESNDTFCTAGGGDCEKVDNSPYSEFGGIGVAVYGTAGYAILIILCIVVFIQRPGKMNILTHFISLGAAIGFAVSVWFTYIEAFVIYEFCPYCVVSAVFMTLIFIAVIIQWLKLRRA